MNDRPGKKRGRKPTLYPYKGRQLSLPELAELSGWNVETLRRRINEGMTPAAATARTHNGKPAGPSTKPEAIVLSYKGEERTLDEWAEVSWVKQRGITKSKLYARLYQDPVWTKEEAFGDVPRVRPGVKKITVETPEGLVEKTMSEWSKYRGIPLSTISVRRARGWTDAQALEYEPGPQELRDAEQAEDDDEQDE